MRSLVLMLLMSVGCFVVNAAETVDHPIQSYERKLSIVYAEKLTPEELQLINQSRYVGFQNASMLDECDRLGKPSPAICSFPSRAQHDAFTQLSLLEQQGETIYEHHFTQAEIDAIAGQNNQYDFHLLIEALMNKLLEKPVENRAQYESPKNWCGTTGARS